MKKIQVERTKNRCLLDALKILVILVVIISIMIGIELLVEGLTVVGNLTVNHETGPMGISTVNEPRFSWNMTSKVKGQAQKTYEIRVYEGEDGNGTPIWTSGEVDSSESMYIRAEGLQLEKEKRYSWRVFVQPVWGWKIVSKAATFVTETDFSDIDWIIPDQESDNISMVRTQVKIRRMTIREAYLYISSMGNYRAYVEGEEVTGPDGIRYVLAPGRTDYHRQVNYQTYDVTENFRNNLFDNIATIGIMLSKGWYGDEYGENTGYETAFGPDDTLCETGVIANLVLHYSDGMTQTISTGNSEWHSSTYTGLQCGGITGSVEEPTVSGSMEEVKDIVSGDGSEGTQRAVPVSCVIDGVRTAENAGWIEDDYTEAVDKWTGVSISDYAGELVSSSAGLAREADEYERNYVSAYLYDESEISGTEGNLNPYGRVNRRNAELTDDDEILLNAGEKLICDFGYYASGQAEITLNGAAGTVVNLTYANRLNEDPGEAEEDATESSGVTEAGPADEDMSGGEETIEMPDAPDGPYGSVRTEGAVSNVYILSGNEEETFGPKETYQGYRYVEITSDSAVAIRSVIGKVFTSEGSKSGEIKTSDEDLNRLIEELERNRRANNVSIPNRNVSNGERNGDLIFAQILAPTDLYFSDSFAFLNHFNNILQSQAERTEGVYGTEAPQNYADDVVNIAGCSDAGILIPWQIYQQSGDIAVLENCFNEMVTYMNKVYMESYEIPLNGDQLASVGTSGKYLAEVYRIYSTQTMQQISEILGKEDFAAAYAERTSQFREEFMNKYLDEGGNILSASADGLTEDKDGTPIADNSQTALFWALKLNLYRTEDQRINMLANLVSDINNPGSMLRPNAPEDSVNVGLLGINIVLPVLTEYGYTDLACELLKQTEYPSWLYALENGNVGRYPDGYAMDSAGEWFYRYLAGIASDMEKPGFKKIIFQPSVDSERRVSYVSASYESISGTIRSEWETSEGKLRNYTCEVPANTTARLYLPISQTQAASMRMPKGAEYTGMDSRNGKACAVIELTSGTFRFRIPVT